MVKFEGRARFGLLHTLVRGVLLIGLLLATAMMWVAQSRMAEAAEDGPTPEEYVAQAGPGAKIVPAGRLTIDGRVVRCGNWPTVIDPNLDDYGAAYPGFLILNPNKLGRLPVAVKLWIYAHECAHQYRGPDETRADCFAVQRGRRQGWLSPSGIEQICSFIRPAVGDAMHFAGSERCARMRQCYPRKRDDLPEPVSRFKAWVGSPSDR